MIWENGPIFIIFWNCSYISRSVNCPCFIFSISSSLSSNFSSFTLSIKPSMSPIPSSLLTKGFVLNGSKSSICSPVPMKMMGLCVAATLTTVSLVSTILKIAFTTQLLINVSHTHTHTYTHVNWIISNITVSAWTSSCKTTPAECPGSGCLPAKLTRWKCNYTIVTLSSLIIFAS